MRFVVEIKEYEPLDPSAPFTASNVEEYLRDALDRREDDGIVIVRPLPEREEG